MQGGRVQSDGNQSRWPQTDDYKQVDHSSHGAILSLRSIHCRTLPAGYSLFRKNDEMLVFGHPNSSSTGSSLDSFGLHYAWLTSNADLNYKDCKCHDCHSFLTDQALVIFQITRPRTILPAEHAAPAYFRITELVWLPVTMQTLSSPLSLHQNSSDPMVYWPSIVTERTLCNGLVVYRLRLLDQQKEITTSQSLITPFAFRNPSSESTIVHFFSSFDGSSLQKVQRGLDSFTGRYNDALASVDALLSTYSLCCEFKAKLPFPGRMQLMSEDASARLTQVISQPHYKSVALGPEVVRVGDFVRLNPSSKEYKQISLSETANPILLMMVENIYTTADLHAHISGSVYTQPRTHRMTIDGSPHNPPTHTLKGHLTHTILYPWHRVYLPNFPYALSIPIKNIAGRYYPLASRYVEGEEMYWISRERVEIDSPCIRVKEARSLGDDQNNFVELDYFGGYTLDVDDGDVIERAGYAGSSRLSKEYVDEGQGLGNGDLDLSVDIQFNGQAQSMDTVTNDSEDFVLFNGSAKLADKSDVVTHQTTTTSKSIPTIEQLSAMFPYTNVKPELQSLIKELSTRSALTLILGPQEIKYTNPTIYNTISAFHHQLLARYKHENTRGTMIDVVTANVGKTIDCKVDRCFYYDIESYCDAVTDALKDSDAQKHLKRDMKLLQSGSFIPERTVDMVAEMDVAYMQHISYTCESDQMDDGESEDEYLSD